MTINVTVVPLLVWQAAASLKEGATKNKIIAKFRKQLLEDKARDRTAFQNEWARLAAEVSTRTVLALRRPPSTELPRLG